MKVFLSQNLNYPLRNSTKINEPIEPKNDVIFTIKKSSTSKLDETLNATEN